MRCFIVLTYFFSSIAFASPSLDTKLTCTVTVSYDRSVDVGATTPKGSFLTLKSLLGAGTAIPLTNPSGTPTQIFIYEELVALEGPGVALISPSTKGELSEQIIVSDLGKGKVGLKLFVSRNVWVVTADGTRVRDFVPDLGYAFICDVIL